MKGAERVREEDLAYMIEHLGDEFKLLSGGHLLVTGGAGFLGYYLVQSALTWNQVAGLPPIKLTVADNFQRGVPEWLTGLDGVSLLRHDVTDPLPAGLAPIDWVIHAAGIASPHLYRKIPIETMDANVGGLRRLLDYSVTQGRNGHPVSGFLFYSSSEIYGDPDPGAIPTPETYRGNVSCTGPRACYDESKRYGETLLVNFVRVHGLRGTIARPFNNYGPGMKINDGRVIADFASSIISGSNIRMLSDGSPTRTFCYSADAVIGYYKTLVHGEPGEPYNIGTDGPEVSMRFLAERMVDIARSELGYHGEVELARSDEADYLIDNPSRRCPDLTKARTGLGYQPGIDLLEGLSRTLAWYAGNRVGVGR